MVRRWTIIGPLLAGFLTTGAACLCPALAKDAPRGHEKDAIGVSVTADLDFGSLADYDGYVELGAADNVLADPQNIFFGGTPYSAIISITGDPDAAISVTINGGTQSGLTLSTFHTDRGTPPLVAVSLGAAGAIELRVGGRLTVDSAAASPGNDHSVPYTITVNYE